VTNKSEFSLLQLKLVPQWERFGQATPGGEIQAPNTAVVIPSLSVDVEIPAAALQAYEERMLFMLLILRQPNTHVIYVTSQPVLPEVISYYLGLVPGIVTSSAHKRLTLVSPQDGTTTPLSEKILARPHIIREIRQHIPDPEQAHMVPFMTTDAERELSVKLGIPMYAADPRHFAFGTKSGARRIFTEEGVQHPPGFEDLHTEAEVLEALTKLLNNRPDLKKAVLKLNEGVSGFGNALISLTDIPDNSTRQEVLRERLKAIQPEGGVFTYQDFMENLAQFGGIVEEYITGQVILSPSVQLRNTPTQEVQILSTHDQMLGGESGQIYMGATFPADPAYSPH